MPIIPIMSPCYTTSTPTKKQRLCYRMDNRETHFYSYSDEQTVNPIITPRVSSISRVGVAAPSTPSQKISRGTPDDTTSSRQSFWQATTNNSKNQQLAFQTPSPSSAGDSIIIRGHVPTTTSRSFRPCFPPILFPDDSNYSTKALLELPTLSDSPRCARFMLPQRRRARKSIAKIRVSPRVLFG
jgi:hypothetical protein